MIMNNYHMIDISTEYTHACLITYIRCTTAGSLSDYLYPSYMLASVVLVGLILKLKVLLVHHFLF